MMMMINKYKLFGNKTLIKNPNSSYTFDCSTDNISQNETYVSLHFIFVLSVSILNQRRDIKSKETNN